MQTQVYLQNVRLFYSHGFNYCLHASRYQFSIVGPDLFWEVQTIIQ